MKMHSKQQSMVTQFKTTEFNQLQITQFNHHTLVLLKPTNHNSKNFSLVVDSKTSKHTTEHLSVVDSKTFSWVVVSEQLIRWRTNMLLISHDLLIAYLHHHKYNFIFHFCLLYNLWYFRHKWLFNLQISNLISIDQLVSEKTLRILYSINKIKMVQKNHKI